MSAPNGILGHDPQLANRLLSSFLRYLKWMQVVSLIGQIALASTIDVPRLAGTVVILAGTFLIQRILDTGRVSLAIHSLLGTLYLAVLPGLAHCGIMVATTLILPATVPLAALLLGMRFGIAYAILNFGTLAFVFWLQTNGWQPPGSPTSLPVWAFVEVMVAFTVVVYQAIPANGLVSALKVSDEKQKELDTVIDRLEAENRKLVAEVDLRTQGLREANDTITRLSASLSHDLRIPLRSILGFTKILSEERLEDGVQSQIAGIQSDISSLQLILEKTMVNLRRDNNA